MLGSCEMTLRESSRGEGAWKRRVLHRARQNAAWSTHSLEHPCPLHSSPVLHWSVTTGTACAMRSFGSAVEGNGSIITISLRNKLVAIH